MRDDNLQPPDANGRPRYKLTKDRILLGPPLGGTLFFTYQAVSISQDPSGTSDLFSLFTALVIGTSGGAKIELLIGAFFPSKPKPPSADPDNEPEHPVKEQTE